MFVNSKAIFNLYFKQKLILWIGIGVIGFIIHIFVEHEISFIFILTMLVFLVLAAVIIGFLDYRFYEKSAPKILSQLLDKEPLLSFQKKGFKKDAAKKLEGQINNYQIILSPLTKKQGEFTLTILIPLRIREGIDKYFTRFDDHFKFTLSGEMLFAEAIIKDYEKEFNNKELFRLIYNTTISLNEKKIEPLKIAYD